MRQVSYLIASALIAIPLSACQSNPGAVAANTQNTLGGVFKARGLEMLPNPATFYRPGTLLRLDGAGGFVIACNDRKVIKDVDGKVLKSPTSSFAVDLKNASALAGNLGLGNLASVAAQHQREAAVVVTISNPWIYEVDDAALQSSDMSPEMQQCAEHLQKKRIQELLPLVTMIKQSYVADVSVTVRFSSESNASAEAKGRLLEEIAGAFGSDGSAGLRWTNSNSGEAVLAGAGLVWAIKRDQSAVSWLFR